MAFAAWTQASGFASMLLAAACWGTFSVVPGQTTQAALTWMWGTEVAPYMNVLHAGFGVGSLLAPLLVSWDLRQHDSFHWYGLPLASLSCSCSKTEESTCTRLDIPC